MSLNVSPIPQTTVTPNTLPGDEQRTQPNVRKITMNTRSGVAAPTISEQVREQNSKPNTPTPAVSDAVATPEQFENGVISTPTETAKETPEETKPLSPQFAELARQRRSLQVKERELIDREKALTTNASGKDGWIDPAQLKSQPLSVLLQHGVTYDQLTEAILADQNGVQPELQKLRDEVKNMKEEFNKTLTEREQRQEQQALAEMQREAEMICRTGEEFALIRETRSVPDVVKLIERTYRETGEVMDVPEAMKLIEDELYSESLRIAGLQKVKEKLVPLTPVAQTQPVQQQQPQQPQMRTLTARDSVQQQMTAKQRAISAFNGTLQK